VRLEIRIHHQDVALGTVILADPCQRSVSQFDA
jgi:hypothetical protein